VQWDIDIRSDPAYFDVIHCSSSLRIFDSLKKANETIDEEMFDYLKETVKNDRSNTHVIEKVNEDGSLETKPASLEPPYDGAFIHGHEEKYRWPLSLPKKGLTDGYHKYGNLQMICMSLPGVLATHENGTTIVTSDTTSDLPLAREFNSLEGVCFDLGMWDENIIHQKSLGACKNCEKTQLDSFREKVINRIEEFRNADYSNFDLVGDVAKKIGYKINYDNLKVNVVSKERKFN